MRVTSTLLSLLMAAPLLAAPDGPRPSPSPSPQAKKDKKEKPAGADKVYTNEDLKTAGSGQGAVTFLSEPAPGATPEPAQNAASESGVSSGNAGSESGTSREAQSGEGRQAASETGTPNDEQSWRARANDQREAIKNAQNELDRLDAELRELELDRDPNPQDLLDPARLQKREGRKTEVRNLIETTRSQLAAARQALEDLEAQARREGIPSRWLEER